MLRHLSFVLGIVIILSAHHDRLRSTGKQNGAMTASVEKVLASR